LHLTGANLRKDCTFRVKLLGFTYENNAYFGTPTAIYRNQPFITTAAVIRQPYGRMRPELQTLQSITNISHRQTPKA